MRILSIETSCDETAVALIEASGGLKKPHFKILKNLVASQIKIHRPFGGVVPSLAKREHIRNLPILLNKILDKTNSSKSKIKDQRLKLQFKIQNFLKTIDLIAVTVGPGLEPCLWVGINFAKEVYSKLKTHNSKLKLVGVSHLDGHLYSFLLSQKTASSKSKILNPKQKTLGFRISNLEFPAISLLVSGGHTILLLMKDLTYYKKLGETRDDAVGECFDKVARLLGLPYPGGPEIEKLAKYGNSDAINFPRPMINQKNYDFSFSGLKTSLFYYLRDNSSRTFVSNGRRQTGIYPGKVRDKNVKIKDVAASFQSAAFDTLISKTLRAVKEYKAKSILISGGVAANKTLQRQFKSIVKSQLSSVNFFVPPKKFCTDNAAMIAAAGYVNYLRNKNHRLKAQGNLTLK